MNTSFKALQLKARHQVYTLLNGHNLSRLHGEGYDFAQLREYQMGDDIRKINWTVTAKLGKPYIKELHANRELSVVTALPAFDGRLYFGNGNAKQDTMVQTAMLIGYAAQWHNDLFSGIAFTQTQVLATPPTKHLFQIEHFMQQLHEKSLLHTAVETQASLDALFGRILKPSLLFVLHDFLEPIDLSLLAQRHEVIALVIRERDEETSPVQGEVILHDPRSAETEESYIGKRNRQRYLARLKENDEKMLAHFSQHDIRYVKIFTNEEPVTKLLELFR